MINIKTYIQKKPVCYNKFKNIYYRGILYVIINIKTYILEESCMTTSTSGFKPMQVYCVQIFHKVEQKQRP